MTYTPNSVNQYTDTANPTETFTYEQDGTLKTDGTYTYKWDGENRLKEIVRTRSGSFENGDKRLVFEYDYLGRRVHKQYYKWDTSLTPSPDWSLQKEQKFIYDGWNVVLVLDGSGNLKLKFTWGLDLSEGRKGGISPIIEPKKGSEAISVGGTSPF